MEASESYKSFCNLDIHRMSLLKQQHRSPSRVGQPVLSDPTIIYLPVIDSNDDPPPILTKGVIRGSTLVGLLELYTS